ncbi:serine-rich adhesin for platelets-like [Teleopsis dalmanni]|uniref:serine-rich adhesin for platelets-like n=1 Tax=Teleopsis dalmanni TaxID=139649 RepID=UPI0018CC9C77|nr:serine-rich adhesin for platelets-like [Teleopsis dalmanni]
MSDLSKLLFEFNNSKPVNNTNEWNRNYVELLQHMTYTLEHHDPLKHFNMNLLKKIDMEYSEKLYQKNNGDNLAYPLNQSSLLNFDRAKRTEAYNNAVLDQKRKLIEATNLLKLLNSDDNLRAQYKLSLLTNLKSPDSNILSEKSTPSLEINMQQTKAHKMNNSSHQMSNTDLMTTEDNLSLLNNLSETEAHQLEINSKSLEVLDKECTTSQPNNFSHTSSDILKDSAILGDVNIDDIENSFASHSLKVNPKSSCNNLVSGEISPSRTNNLFKKPCHSSENSSTLQGLNDEDLKNNAVLLNNLFGIMPCSLEVNSKSPHSNLLSEENSPSPTTNLSEIGFPYLANNFKSSNRNCQSRENSPSPTTHLSESALQLLRDSAVSYNSNNLSSPSSTTNSLEIALQSLIDNSTSSSSGLLSRKSSPSPSPSSNLSHPVDQLEDCSALYKIDNDDLESNSSQFNNLFETASRLWGLNSNSPQSSVLSQKSSPSLTAKSSENPSRSFRVNSISSNGSSLSGETSLSPTINVLQSSMGNYGQSNTNVMDYVRDTHLQINDNENYLATELCEEFNVDPHCLNYDKRQLDTALLLAGNKYEWPTRNDYNILKRKYFQMHEEDKYHFPKFKNTTRGHFVVIGPNGTEIKRSAFERIIWQPASNATRALLVLIFGEETLATHSLSGFQRAGTGDLPRQIFKKLDPDTVADITHCVMVMSKATEREIRVTINQKCSVIRIKYKKLAIAKASQTQ